MEQQLNTKTVVSLWVKWDGSNGPQRRMIQLALPREEATAFAGMLMDEARRSRSRRRMNRARLFGRLGDLPPPNEYERMLADMAQALVDGIRATMNDDSAGAEGPLQDEASASRADARPSEPQPSPAQSHRDGAGDGDAAPVADQTTLGQMEHAVESASRLIMLPSADFGATPEAYRHSLSRLLALIAIWLKGGANVDRDRN